MEGIENTAAQFSMWSALLEANWGVKLIVLLLIIASIISWTIIIEKSLKLKNLHNYANKCEGMLASGTTLDSLYNFMLQRANDPFSSVFINGIKALKSKNMSLNRTYIVMRNVAVKKMQQITGGMSFLGSIGSIAPFVGLLGMILGLVDAFRHLALSGNANILNIAPAIAESFITTALGFIVSIPAIMAYHKLNSSIDDYEQRLGVFLEEMKVIINEL